jgi:hypothetical protein
VSGFRTGFKGWGMRFRGAGVGFFRTAVLFRGLCVKWGRETAENSFADNRASAARGGRSFQVIRAGGPSFTGRHSHGQTYSSRD